MTEIVFATGNQDKLRELSQIFADQLPQVSVIGYSAPSPIENGTSFIENALIKARAAAAATGRLAIADDSGIAVRVMGGAPGIFSARWAGSNASDAANVELLLAQLADIPTQHRQAEFVCAAVAVWPEGDSYAEQSVLASWPGVLLSERRGSAGFGYDPVFMPEGFDVSAAELAPEIKNSVSHRYRAFSGLITKINKRIVIA